MNEPTMETLARRLDRVERENRRMKQAGVVALAVIAAVVLMGQATPTKGAKVVEMPDFFTWAFWNSPLVTTIIGAFVFTGAIVIIAAVISHRLERRRKVFDFKLDVFRSFNELCRAMLTEGFEFYHSRGTVPESEFIKKDTEWSYQVFATFNNEDAQINAVFSDKSIRVDLQNLRDILGQIREKTLETPKAPFHAEIQPLFGNYLGQAEIIRLKMRKEMDLVSSNEYENLMQAAKE